MACKKLNISIGDAHFEIVMADDFVNANGLRSAQPWCGARIQANGAETIEVPVLSEPVRIQAEWLTAEIKLAPSTAILSQWNSRRAGDLLLSWAYCHAYVAARQIEGAPHADASTFEWRGNDPLISENFVNTLSGVLHGNVVTPNELMDSGKECLRLNEVVIDKMFGHPLSWSVAYLRAMHYDGRAAQTFKKAMAAEDLLTFWNYAVAGFKQLIPEDADWMTARLQEKPAQG